MQSFIITLLICSVTMSALALFYMAVTPLLAKRYSVASRYYTWLVVVIGFIIPFRPQFSNAIVKVDIPSNTVVPNIQIGNGTPVTAPLENALPSALPTISLCQVAAIVWFVGMIVFLVYHVIKHYHFLKLVARWSKDITDEQTLTLAKDELSFILKHELVHYQRKDLWYKCLVLVVLCGVLMLTLGTGFTFAAKAETQEPPESIKEDSIVSAEFIPDPAIYANYTNISLNELGANEVICIGQIGLEQGIDYRLNITAESGDGLFDLCKCFKRWRFSNRTSKMIFFP